ncbi:MAG: hypothetical protein WBC95_16335, partial [Albidovulum sp.]
VARKKRVMGPALKSVVAGVVGGAVSVMASSCVERGFGQRSQALLGACGAPRDDPARQNRPRQIRA